MGPPIIIEKLIIEVEVGSEQEYHQFSRQFQNHLYELLLKELEPLLSEILSADSTTNLAENIIIEKIEIEVPDLSFKELNSQDFVSSIKDSFASGFPDFNLRKMEESKSLKKNRTSRKKEQPPTGNTYSAKYPSLHSSSQTNRNVLSTTKISKPESIQYFLLTGQFLHGIILSSEEIREHLLNPKNQTDLIEWISALPSIPQQQIALHRLFLHLPFQQKKSILAKPEWKSIILAVPDLTDPFPDKEIISKKDILGYTNRPFFPAEKSPPVPDDNTQKEDYEQTKASSEGAKTSPEVWGQTNQKQSKESSDPSPTDSKDLIQSNGSSTTHPIDPSQTPPEELTEENNSQLSQKKAPPSIEKKQLSARLNLLPMQEGIYVVNAGIVLVSPFLQALFQRCELLDSSQNAFLSEYAAFYAIHLLQYMADTSTVKTEDTTLIFKVLCGIPVDEPFPLNIELSDKDKDRVNRLLLQIVNQWDIKLGGEINMLRGSFFLRGGKLTSTTQYWSLTVETKLYDPYLFEKLPWSFRHVKLPWMSKLLQVEWY